MPVYLLSKDLTFPPPYLAEEDGLLAIGGDLSVERLLIAYSQGIFPWYSDNSPILWWSPDPRYVIFLEKFHIPKRLKRLYNQNKFTITIDKDFESVIKLCASVHKKEDGSTWITKDMILAYTKLHKLGYTHSVETWKDGKIVGGLYGVSIGRVFSGESMFSIEDNASKLALVHLALYLKSRDYIIIDCQTQSQHLKQFGAEPIPRSLFIKLLKENLNKNLSF